jgi:hypothetical protein
MRRAHDSDLLLNSTEEQSLRFADLLIEMTLPSKSEGIYLFERMNHIHN